MPGCLRLRPPIAHVARDLGIHHETLRKWVRETEADGGKRKELLSSQEREELKALRGEVRELRHSEAGRLNLTFHFFATPSALLRPGMDLTKASHLLGSTWTRCRDASLSALP